MIELNDLSSDESFDDTVSSNIGRSPSIVRSSLDESHSSNLKYNTSNIKMFLKEQPEKYTLVNNQRINHTKSSACWNQFALPAVKDENNRHIIIKNFATCRSCYKTNTYTHGSTKSLKDGGRFVHKTALNANPM